MRIISGKFRSRHLKGTPPADLRPTGDKLRGTLFNILGPSVEGSDFLDGFSGMGAIGIEAISRGARSVHFVDSSRKACAMIRENLGILEVRDGYHILEMEFPRACRLFERDAIAFDIAFLDPPYGREDLYTRALKSFGILPLLKEGAILVMEHAKRQLLPDASGFLRKFRALNQGDSSLSFYRKDT